VTRSVRDERSSSGETIKGRRFQWLVRLADSTCASQLAGALSLPPLVSRLLSARGITAPTQARSFLARRLADLPNPCQLPDVERAVARIGRALRVGEPMVVFGDYDVDGVTATALLYHFLSGLGAKVGWYLPHRLREGYGLNPGAIRELSGQGVRLLISVDCGSSDHEAILLARSLGMEVIVTDHHHLPEITPEAVTLVNPRRLSDGGDLSHLAGVGVAFYVVSALRAHLRRAGWWEKAPEPNLRRYLDWVALGTLADVAPLTHINRILSAAGLRVLSEEASPGMRALKEVCGLTESSVSGWDVLFRLGPRLNAAGRLDSADLAIRLLLTEDVQEARALAVKLDEINRQRQALEERTLAEALTHIEADHGMQDRRALVLTDPSWHKGLLGLAAARLVERFNKPAILLTRGVHGWEGSGRSPAGIDLYGTLTSCRAYLRRFGGHHSAAGLSLPVEQLAFFRGALEEVLSQVDPESPRPREADTRAHLREITPCLMSYVELMGPFGAGNPEPILCCDGFRVESLQVLKDRHVKLRISQGDARLTAIGFNLAQGGEVSLAPRRIFASPVWNSWQGERRLELQIHDYEGERLAG
jgi:single-stranded-DNA-specific exonuclease